MGEGRTAPSISPAPGVAAAEAPLSPTGEAHPRRRPAKRRRVLIGDARGSTRYLRTTWHRETNVFVLSTWADEVCTGSVRVPVTQAPELISLLADGLGEAAGLTAEVETPQPGASPRLADRLLSRLGLARAPRRRGADRRRASRTATSAQVLKLR